MAHRTATCGIGAPPGWRPLVRLPAIAAAVVAIGPLAGAWAYDQHFDYTSFETNFQQSQFNVLNYPSINGNYMMTSTDNHRPEMVAAGNNLAEFYNNFLADYNKSPKPTAAEEADAINAYTLKNSTKNGPRPDWLILNELSSSLWQQNPGVPSLSTHRQWVIDAVTRLNDVYGYKVIAYSPYQTLGTTANAPSWQALAAKAYIAIEAYLSGPEVMGGGSTYASRVASAQSKYQAAKNSYLAVGIPASKLFVSEHFANNGTTQDNGNPITWGRAGLPSASDWDQVLMIRQDAIFNVGFDGFLAYNWGGNGLGVTQAEQIQHEYYYRSRRVLPSQKPQWLSDSAPNVNGTVIPLSWNQPLNWLGGVPNAAGAQANFWRTNTASRTITLDGDKTVGKLTFDSSFRYTIGPGSGGALSFDNSGSPAVLVAAKGSHTIGVNVNLTSSLNAAITSNLDTVTISGGLSGAGGLTKSGAGTLVLGGANSYAGATAITAGVLLVGNTLDAPGAAIEVESAGKLDASGAIPRNIVNSGVIAGPVASVGSGQWLRLTGPVSGAGDYMGNIAFASSYSPGSSPASVSLGNTLFEPGAALQMEIGGLIEGAQYDHLEVGGLLTMGGSLIVSLTDEFTPQPGDAFNLFDWTSVSGAFDYISVPAVDGVAWDASNLYSSGTLKVVSAADFNLNGAVEEGDLSQWQSGFGANGQVSNFYGDANGDQTVDGADWLIWQQQFGAGTTTAGNSSVAEPTSLISLVTAYLVVGVWRASRRESQL